MKEEKDILKQIGRKDGMTVPEGYFADFTARMAQSLEKTDFESSIIAAPIKQSLWHRVRPYVYMAAMFAGIWCMLKMFSMFTSQPDNVFSSPVLAEALGNEVFVSDYIYDNYDTFDLMDEMMEDGIDIDSLYTSFDEIVYDQDLTL